MSYQRKSLQIIGGTFNLNAPGDKVAPTDYLLAQNWRVDRDGKLVSRWGYQNYASYAGAGTLNTAMVWFSQGAYWSSAAGKLYFGGSSSPINPIFFNSFDGNRLGIVGMLGYAWVINRRAQMRHLPGGGGNAQVYNATAAWSGSVAPTAAAGAAGTLNGTYSVWVTAVYKDPNTGLITESNPSGSAQITVANQNINLSSIPTALTSGSNLPVNGRNIYLSGGTLGQAYLAIPYASSYASIEDNVTTTATITLGDSAITNLGIAMPTTNDSPPAASGVVGPYFNRLIAFSTFAHPNRLFWTQPGLPQYWPGAANPSVGNWVDVGQDGEAIIWCTAHTNVLVIYKQKSIWRLVGDVSTGYLERVDAAMGLNNAFAVVEAGKKDYFVGPNGLYAFNLDATIEITGAVRPLFNTNSTRILGPDQAPPGSVTTTASGSGTVITYNASLGYAMGKLYVGYQENTVSPQYGAPVLVYHEDSGRWAYHRSTVLTSQVAGFMFDGTQMVAMGTDGFGNGVAWGVDDFSVCSTTDPGFAPLACHYQSHYEDVGLPDNQKNWLEVVVDCEVNGSDQLSVTAYFDNGTATTGLQGLGIASLPLGAITSAGKRQQVSFPINPLVTSPTQPGGGYLAKNISIAVTGLSCSSQVVIHNVHLYYYVEARLAMSASSLPTDLGLGRVKQCKELQLDVDASRGGANISVYSDLPGNTLALRQSPVQALNGGRAILKYPFPVTEGYLWKLALAGSGGPFRLYSARLLMRPVGVYVEAYEAAGGFVWDSQEQTFESGITHVPKAYAIALAASPIKRFREVSFQIDTFGGAVTYAFLTDLPGNIQAVQQTGTINTGTAGRRFIRIPLPAGTNPPIEGRMCRIQLSGASKFILYECSVECLAVGVYVEAYEAAGGAVYDSREQDLGTPNVKECRELELDIETTGAVTWKLLSDISSTATGTVTTTGRQKMMLPLTTNAALEQFVDGRLLRLLLTGANAYRLYGARVKVRPYGMYLSTAEATGGALWDSTDLDLGTQTVKQLRELEIEIQASAGYTVTVYTDLPGNAMASRVVSTQTATSGRTKVQIPLPQGQIPDNYVFGRLMRATITSAGQLKLFGARVHVRPIGVYVESYEAAGGAVWDSLPQDCGNPFDKQFDEVRLELDTDGAASLAVWTDLPGEAMGLRQSGLLTSGATGRHWATVPLANLATSTPPWSVEGRSIRLLVTSTSGFRIYRAQVRSARVGRYLAASTLQGNDPLATLEFDFASERVKQFKKLELDLRADGQVSAQVYANPNGQMVQQFTTTVATPNGRQTIYVPLPPGVRGRLLRVVLSGPNAARIFKVRAWTRPLNEPNGAWAWADYPLEDSEVLPAWTDLPVDPTPPAFKWADLPVPPTPTEWAWGSLPVGPTPPAPLTADPAQWFWGKVLSVDDTPERWDWVDVDMQVTG